MSDTFSKVEVITGVARRRRFSTELKLALVAESMQPGMSVSYVARRHGLSPSLVFRWRRLMSEGGKEAVRADDEVVAASEARSLEERVRELERLLGRKTMRSGERRVGEEGADLCASDLARAARKPGAPTTRWWRRPRRAAWKSGCASWSGYWAARPWKSRSSRRLSNSRGQKNRSCCRARRFPEIPREAGHPNPRCGAL